MGDSNVKRLEVYQDKAGGWRWRAIAGNGEIVSEGESHTREHDAARAAQGVFGHDVLLVRGGRDGLTPAGPVDETENT